MRGRWVRLRQLRHRRPAMSVLRLICVPSLAREKLIKFRKAVTTASRMFWSRLLGRLPTLSPADPACPRSNLPPTPHRPYITTSEAVKTALCRNPGEIRPG